TATLREEWEGLEKVMAHAVIEEPPLHMGLPLANGKMAVWFFLITEIMFFTALIGVYVLLRNGQPTASHPWPTPAQVHLSEPIGALNTAVLIASSVTVVLAHWCIGRRDTKRCVLFIGISLALGTVFLGIKAYEYNAKFEHDILPGHIGDRLDGPPGQKYVERV